MTTPECRSDRVNQVTLAFDQSNCVVVSSGVINHTMFFFFCESVRKDPLHYQWKKDLTQTCHLECLHTQNNKWRFFDGGFLNIGLSRIVNISLVSSRVKTLQRNTLITRYRRIKTVSNNCLCEPLEASSQAPRQLLVNGKQGSSSNTQ